MTGFASACSAWRKKERGAAEILTFIFVLPTVVAILFLLVEIGVNMYYRSIVDNIVAETTRAVMLDGTSGIPPPWSTRYPGNDAEGLSCVSPSDGNAIPCWGSYEAVGHFTWRRAGQQKLQELCGTSNARCKPGRTATMVCTPNQTSSVGPRTETFVAPNPGVPVRCTGTLPYRNLVSFTINNQLFNLGFGGFWGEDIVTSSQAMTMIGSGE